MRGRGRLVAVVAALLVVAEGVAAAQDIDVQRWHPPATSGGFVSAEESRVRSTLDPLTFGLWATYAYDPLVLVGADGALLDKIVEHQLGFDATFSFAVADLFEAGIDVPFGVQVGEDRFGGSSGVLGDIRLVPKLMILDDRVDGVGLGAVAEVRLPTHAGAFSGGSRIPVFAPRLLLDHRFGEALRLGLNLGAVLRDVTRYENIDAGSELTADLALGYRIGVVELLAELDAGIGLAATDPEEVALELLAGVTVQPAPDWTLVGAGGMGVMEGYGIPTFRVLIGVRWEPSFNDLDHDGIPNESDVCPNVAEDRDGDADGDGCPEGDMDGDGVLDLDDRCPEEAEVINGFEDEDGCPDEGPARIVVTEGRLDILEPIQFEIASAKIKDDSEPILDQIVLTMRAHPEIRLLRIEGHTDNTGKYETNVKLSKDRAKSVRNYLIAHGIEESRLTSEGYGPDRPIDTNDTPEGRSRNRRVDFVIEERGN